MCSYYNKVIKHPGVRTIMGMCCIITVVKWHSENELIHIENDIRTNSYFTSYWK